MVRFYRDWIEPGLQQIKKTIIKNQN